MSYRSDVAKARRLIKRSEADQWEIAELTYVNVEAGTSRTAWARDVGISREHAGYLYRIFAEYGDRRPAVSFADAYAKVRTGDDAATGTSRRVDNALKDATPAQIAKAVAERHDVQRAVARNDAAREGVEEEAIAHRARYRDETPTGTAKQVGRNVGRALGLDEVVDHLRTAAREIGKATAASEEIEYDEADAAEAVEQIKRALRVWARTGDALSDTDRAFLAEIGVRA